MNGLVLPILIIFVVAILFIVFQQYQKSATERAAIASRSAEIQAIAGIYQTKGQLAIAKEEGKTTAKDWIAGVGSVADAAASIFTGISFGGDE